MAEKVPEKISRNKFLSTIKKNQEREKENVKRENERIKEVKSKIKSKLSQYENPVHVDFHTFELMARKNGAYSKNGKVQLANTIKGFGTSNRFDLDENQKWKNKIEKINKQAGQIVFDPNVDAAPGPHSYNLICHWKGKKNSTKELKKGMNYLEHISTGPKISLYYS